MVVLKVKILSAVVFCSLQNDGRLRFSKQNVVYKSSKTGKVDNIAVSDINLAQWRRVCLGHGIKLCTSTGHIYKYDGFKDSVSVYCIIHDNTKNTLDPRQKITIEA